MSSYLQDKKIQDATRARKYIYDPVMFDRLAPLANLKPGDLVIKTQPHGCPRNGTMSQTYIANAGTGEFIGMVCTNSLRPVQSTFGDRYRELMHAVQLYLKAKDQHDSAWDFEGSVGIPEMELLDQRATADLELVRRQIVLRETFRSLGGSELSI